MCLEVMMVVFFFMPILGQARFKIA
uniref:Uncharacterized protein n=1 Tax=Arundo donax TaxID=35708 RepID=A0A0A8ZTU3_ARUDO